MKPALALALLGLAFASVALAEDLVTIDGKVYKNYTIALVEPDGLQILYDEGGAKVPFRQLPKEVQKKWGYNPDEAKSYAAAKHRLRVAEATAMGEELQRAARIKDVAGIFTWRDADIEKVRRELQYLESTTVPLMEGIRLQSDATSRDTARREARKAEIAALREKLDAMEKEIAPLKAATLQEAVDAVPYEKIRAWALAAMDHELVVGMPVRWVLLSLGEPASKATDEEKGGELWTYHHGEETYKVRLNAKGEVVALE